MADSYDRFPRGRDPIYRSLISAGVSGAVPLRNIAWICNADDGTAVVNVWRDQLEKRGNEWVAVLKPRSWKPKGSGARKKTLQLAERLNEVDGELVRVVVLELSEHKSGLSAGSRYEPTLWLVQDTGNEFVLWCNRSAAGSAAVANFPKDPIGFGKLEPERKWVVSEQIERDPAVKHATLKRAKYRCEIVDCDDNDDYESPEVHHITRLGDGGSDHTDNTVALCPACHKRVHQGVAVVKARIIAEIARIRNGRLLGHK